MANIQQNLMMIDPALNGPQNVPEQATSKQQVGEEEGSPKRRSSPCKRKAKKKITPICSKSLRRNARLNNDLQGFRTRENAEAAATFSGSKEDGPLVSHAIVLAQKEGPSTPAPFLSKENVKAIATGFLKMHPTAVSDEALENPPNNDNNEA
ncbi:hypothetical protein ACP4OV_011236 [Aristida adscensionis]